MARSFRYRPAWTDVGLAVDLVGLIIILAFLDDESLEWRDRFLVALGTTMVKCLLDLLVIRYWGFGPWGVALNTLLVVVGLGITLSAWVGMEIKRAGQIAALYGGLHIATGVLFPAIRFW